MRGEEKLKLVSESQAGRIPTEEKSSHNMAASGKTAPVRKAAERPWEPVRLSEEVQHRFLEALVLAGTLDEACRRAGITRGAALAARARDAMFALAWDRVNDSRLAEIESLLLEKTVRGLTRPEGTTDTAQEKFVASLGQWFLEARVAHRYGKAAARRPAGAPGGEGQPAAGTETPAADRVRELLDRTAKRLAEAEAADR